LQKNVDREKKQSKTFWERTSPVRDSIGAVGTICAIIFGSLTLSNNKENSTLKTENKAFVDSLSQYRKENESLKDSISLYLKRNKEYQNKDSVQKVIKQ
jgi:hypothetical protein